MGAAIKAIVFKTTQLKATKAFFENVLKLPIKESSVRHFVIYSKRIWLVFVESLHDFEVAMYLNDKSNPFSEEIQIEPTVPALKSGKDSNGISIIITDTN